MPSKIIRRDQVATGLVELETATGRISYQSQGYFDNKQVQETWSGITRTEAKRKHRKRNSRIDDGDRPTSLVGVGDVRDRAFAHYRSLIDVEAESGEKAPLSKATLDLYRVAWTLRVSPFRVGGKSIDELPLAGFSRAVAREFLKHLRTEYPQLASSTRNGTLTAVRTVLRWARESELMDYDPFHALPKGERPAQKPRPGWEGKVLTEGERLRVIEAALSERFVNATPGVLLTNIVIVLAVTGARLAEAGGARWGSVDGNGLSFQEQMVRDAKGETKPHMKNGEVARRPALQSRYLAEALQRQAAHELSKGRGLSEHLMYTTATGAPITAHQIKEAVRRATRLAGLGNHGPQVLRRTMGTLLAAAKVSPKEASEVMGHSIETYLRSYVKPLLDRERAVAIGDLMFSEEAA